MGGAAAPGEVQDFRLGWVGRNPRGNLGAGWKQMVAFQTCDARYRFYGFEGPFNIQPPCKISLFAYLPFCVSAFVSHFHLQVRNFFFRFVWHVAFFRFIFFFFATQPYINSNSELRLQAVLRPSISIPSSTRAPRSPPKLARRPFLPATVVLRPV